MLSIRLSPKGRKHQRTYRIVVAEKRTKLNGKFIDDLGHWNPFIKEFKIDHKKLEEWTKKGAQVSQAITKLLQVKILNKEKK